MTPALLVAVLGSGAVMAAGLVLLAVLAIHRLARHEAVVDDTSRGRAPR